MATRRSRNAALSTGANFEDAGHDEARLRLTAASTATASNYPIARPCTSRAKGLVGAIGALLLLLLTWTTTRHDHHIAADASSKDDAVQAIISNTTIEAKVNISKEGEKIILRNTHGSASPKASTHNNASTSVESTTAVATEIEQFVLLQRCLDEHTSMGSWEDGRWISLSSEQMCPSFDKMRLPRDTLDAFTNLTIGFMGDSTTRSDLRAWEELFGCHRTDLDEASVFQKKDKHGSYVCQAAEQSINLTKCGIPPIINMTNCPQNYDEGRGGRSVVSFRYFYKIYAWTPLDEWYFQQPALFDDVDVLVVSVGRWLKYRRGQTNLTEEMETFIQQLQRVYSGLILYQSQYATHTVPVHQSKYPVNCTHGLMNDKYECEERITNNRPIEDDQIRPVVESYQILYLDRWSVSKSLPLEYYNEWLCGRPSFHSWSCDHHLSFVAMEHFRMIASIINHYKDANLPLLQPHKDNP